MATPLLEVKDLHTYFKTVDGTVKAVNGVSFEVEESRVLGIVGESGSGKTVTALSIMQLVPHPGKVIQGSVRFAGQELVGLDEKAMRGLRGKDLSMVFQNAAEALNPVISVGEQITEVVHQHTRTSFREARALAASLLTQMGIPDAKALLDSYPYQISGGMAQRVMLAMGIALKPRLLIADEPTSNLDVTIQAEILHRMEQQRKENNSSVLLITHDLGVIAQMAQEVVIMYGGRVLERSDTRGLFARPRHPYTAALLKAIPRVDSAGSRLQAIKGSLPKMIDPPDQCPYLERCNRAVSSCRTGPMPPLSQAEPGHTVACYNPIPKPA